MKKFAPFIILFLIALVAWEALLDPSGMEFVLDGDELHGPGGALLAGLFASGGLLIGIVAAVVAVAVVAVVFAGLGIMALAGLAVGALALALAVSPLLLPILVPLAIIWYVKSRNRKQLQHQHLAGQQA